MTCALNLLLVAFFAKVKSLYSYFFRFIKPLVAIAIFLCVQVIESISWGQTQTYSAATTVYNFITSGNLTSIPAGTTLKIECIGGGGGGGGGDNGGRGGGGGGGAYSFVNYEVSSLSTLNVSVGGGGAGGTCVAAPAPGGNGVLSSVINGASTLCSAIGGSGGIGKYNAGNGAGGAGGSTGVGTISKGGNGATTSNWLGGGGGGGAWQVIGNNGNAQNGGVGISSGGAGGKGGASTDPGTGSPGLIYGGGGGGAGNISGGCYNGGKGANGYVRITVVPPACTTPTSYTVTGGGSYCSGGSGVAIGLSNSQVGVSYQLYNGSANVGASIAGTGGVISFGNQTAAATYTVRATGSGSFCTGPTVMTGSVVVSVVTAQVITSQPAAASTCENGSLNFTVASSTGSPTYQWQYYNTTTSSWENTTVAPFSGNALATLSINPTPIGYNGLSVRCIVSNGTCSTTSNSATMTITATASSGTVSAGTSPQCIGSTTNYTVSGSVLGGGSGAWSSSNTAIATVNAVSGLVTAVGSGSCSIIYTVTGGCGGTKSSQASYTVHRPSTLPTAISADNNSLYNCVGRTITLTEVGGVLEGTSQYIWGTTLGGTDISSGTLLTSVTTTPSQTTTYYVGVSANGACPAQYLNTSLTYTLPTRGSILSNNNEAATCYVSGINPIHFYASASGNYIGSINPNGRQGTLTMTSYVGSSDIMDACNLTGVAAYQTAYMRRNFTVIPTGSITGTTDLSVYFPFKDVELEGLISTSIDGTTGNPYDNVNGINDLFMSKFSGLVEDGIPTNNCGSTGTIIPLVNRGVLSSILTLSPIISGNVGQVNVPSFSEFYFQGRNNISGNNSPLPVTLTHFSASCNLEVLLNWTTASEQNAEQFVVESSTDLIDWEERTRVLAAGNSNIELNYTSTDVLSRTGINYYRLVQLDLDGKQTVYGPISVDCAAKNDEWLIFPNPSNGNFTVQLNAISEMAEVSISVLDMTGKIVYEQPLKVVAGVNQFYLAPDRLVQGNYIIRIDAKNQTPNHIKLVVN